MYPSSVSAFGMPRFALHVVIFTLSTKEDNNDDPPSLPLVADNGSIGGASPDTNCLWRAFSSRRLGFAACAGGGGGGSGGGGSGGGGGAAMGV
jgi:hypothetical protein